MQGDASSEGKDADRHTLSITFVFKDPDVVTGEDHSTNTGPTIHHHRLGRFQKDGSESHVGKLHQIAGPGEFVFCFDEFDLDEKWRHGLLMEAKMKALMRLLTLVLVLGIHLPACQSSDGRSTPNTAKKGGMKMMTYYMGRFAIDVPVEMKQAVQAHTFRLLDIEEGHWDNNCGDISRKREEKWNEHLKKVESLEKPKGVKKIIIKEVQLDGFGLWAKGVLFYGDYMANDEGNWDILVDYGDIYTFFKLDGLLNAQDKMLNWMKPVIDGYKPKLAKPTAMAAFYTKLGEINLPYRRQEKTYSRFERQSPDLKLEIEMSETHKVEQLGMTERLAAAITTRFAPGVDVEKLRSRRRTVGGLKGEELVIRMTASGEDSQVQFGWEYLGEAESGEHPEIQITMESPDSDVPDNLKIWDAILDSFKPMYH